MNCLRVKKFREKLENFSSSDYHGLNSPGLTCYLNSVLQVLFMTEDFREAVKSKHAASIDRLLRELFVDLEGRSTKTHKIANELGITDVFKQHDAAEYFEKLLCLTSPEASKIFKGELNHRTTCCGCGQKSDSKNFFWVLPLGADSDQKSFSVQQGLSGFFKVQRVCRDNQMYCNICNRKHDADIECEMTQSPDVLTLLLKRFSFDYKQNRYIKLQCKADVAQTLLIQGCRYELYAVVHHFGDLTGGHYTAEIKSFETGQWYCFNDKIVKSVRRQYFEVGDNSLRSYTAYLLMYRKVTPQPKKTDRGHLEAHAAYSGFKAEEMRGVAESREPDHQRKKEYSREWNDKDLNGDVFCGNPTGVFKDIAKRQKSDLHTEGTSALYLRKSGDASMSDPKLIKTSSERRDNTRVNGTKTHLSDPRVKPSEATAVTYNHKACAGTRGKSTEPELKNQTSSTPHVDSSLPPVSGRSRSLCRGNGSVERHSSADCRQRSGSLKKLDVQTRRVVAADSSYRLKASQTEAPRGRTLTHTGAKKHEDKDKKTPWRS
ncbi:ubiquitin carboxyl-terminal hydrolase 47-like isoform 2-T4 [Odontesthes bonariensis]|uniref:ubiquitin carboxyl-terminal hydrolase 47-like isoform X2 n=1 Tax=Odontesthes bonariensis TaxID=219752 RepID=UPI003F58F184